jgi:CRISPR-associated endonuclease/helicase Cas3
MHVLFVSACEKRAIKRTRAVLDSYALRTGEQSWASPMTQEGLREIRAALKRTATRQTAVACYRNEGRQRMKLLWVVGSRKAFGPDGHYPAGTTRAKSSAPPPDWVRVASLLAQAAGWCHDLGKASVLFQDKLRQPGAVRDWVRHEWISMRLLQAMRTGKSWDEAWEELARNERRLTAEPFGQGIASVHDALDYLVASHHRLMGPTGKAGRPDHSNHFSEQPADRARLKPQAALPAEALDTAKRLLERIAKLAPEADHRYWRAVATIARAGLILADHQVSAEARPGDTALHANTKDGQLNQPLFWHLQNVASTAADMAYRLATLRLPGLSEETVESICQLAGEGYRWQNRAADALAAFRERSSSPMLLFNMAATGSGKTRMNARAACVLATGPVRFTVSLNLRTLTLQTGDAYRQQLNIGEDELACVIGDRITQALHQLRDREDCDGNTPEAEFETSSDGFYLPAWLEPLTKAKPVLKAVLGAPLLVSTVDFLIAAGMPQRQGHHAMALMRFADSDLILDEVDGYDPKPLVAILRLVQIAALFGRNVICSTATLAEPVANAVYRAYRSGAELRATLLGEESRFACGLIDNYGEPSIAENVALDGFAAFYGKHLDGARPTMGGQGARLAYLQRVEDRSEAGWRTSLTAAVSRLHGDHGWVHWATGRRISFGLVRIANVSPAIATARHLAKALPQARVACYHARDFRVQRYLKERRLDRWLNRKQGNRAIENDREIGELLERAGTDEILFIVVATPVEEVGRDHDFDWAVIEPSSTRSIVQTAGRVNRHRNLAVSSPNIAVMQYNLRTLAGRNPPFSRPGFETTDIPYRSHDLGELLNWSPLLAIDAGLMFDGHPFAELDNRSIAAVLSKVEKRLFDTDCDTPWWANQGIYEEFPLREDTPEIEAMVDETERFRLWLREAGKDACWVTRTPQETPRIGNDWLAWSLDELMACCRELGLPTEQGIRFSLTREDFSMDWSFGAHH